MVMCCALFIQCQYSMLRWVPSIWCNNTHPAVGNYLGVLPLWRIHKPFSRKEKSTYGWPKFVPSNIWKTYGQPKISSGHTWHLMPAKLQPTDRTLTYMGSELSKSPDNFQTMQVQLENPKATQDLHLAPWTRNEHLRGSPGQPKISCSQRPSAP